MSFLADRYQQFTEDLRQGDLFNDFLISDYDVSKSLIFAQATLQTEEFKLYRKLFNMMHKSVKKPGLYIYVHRNTGQLLKNIEKRGRSYETEIKEEYLSKIQLAYKNYLKTVPSHKKIIISANDLDYLNKESDFEIVKQLIQDKLLEILT